MFPDPNSVVDSLKSRGYRSDFNSRRELAHDLGMYDYRGTPQQNMALNRYVQNNM